MIDLEKIRLDVFLQGLNISNNDAKLILARLQAAESKLLEMEKRAPIYQWMTDGDDEGWIDCSRDWFDHIKLLSAHATRIVYALPVPQDIISEITRACDFGFITDELKMIAEENKCK